MLAMDEDEAFRLASWLVLLLRERDSLRVDEWLDLEARAMRPRRPDGPPPEVAGEAELGTASTAPPPPWRVEGDPGAL
ncbi:MAG: hypothetical protein WC700_10330 [Gemmatimonadaceae bacterium]|jgi:hypothetical protein